MERDAKELRGAHEPFSGGIITCLIMPFNLLIRSFPWQQSKIARHKSVLKIHTLGSLDRLSIHTVPKTPHFSNPALNSLQTPLEPRIFNDTLVSVFTGKIHKFLNSFFNEIVQVIQMILGKLQGEPKKKRLYRLQEEFLRFSS